MSKALMKAQANINWCMRHVHLKRMHFDIIQFVACKLNCFSQTKTEINFHEFGIFS